MVSPLQTSPTRRAAPNAGRILAIDYGRKRVGLALSDELGLTSRPLTTLARTNRRDDLRRIRLLVREHQVRAIVVGLPLRLDGTTGEMALEVQRFATRLTKELGLPVEMMDERLTSWEAGEIPLAGNRGRTAAPAGKANRNAAKSEEKVPRDDVAAALILRDYLALRSGPSSTKQSRGNI